MITLTGQREIAGCQVYLDDADPLAVYLMPQAPRVALDDEGKPMVGLTWYRRDVAELTDEERRTKLGGGILTLSAELAATEEQEEEIRTAMASDPRFQRRNRFQRRYDGKVNKLARAIKLGTVPIKDGTVQITVLAEQPGEGVAGEFVESLVGVGRVSMVGKQRASFMAKLSQDGAVLLWKMFEQDLAAIRVAYDMQFDHRLDAVTMTVWCDAEKTYDVVHEQWQELRDKATFYKKKSGGWTTVSASRSQSHAAKDILRETSTAHDYSKVTITPEGSSEALTPELIAQLTEVGYDMISDFLSATFLQWSPGADVTFDEQPELATELPEYKGRKYGNHSIDYYNLKDWSQSMEAELHHVFKTKQILEGFVAPNDNLTGIFAGHDVDEFRTQIELDADWYKYLDVEVVSTADFDHDPVDLVKVHLDYDESGSQGRVREVKDFVFQKGTPPQHFRTFLADPSRKSYRYDYEVFYSGSDETLEVRGRTDDTILVLDADNLGVLHVEVIAGLVNWDQVRSALVKLWYGTGSARKEIEVELEPENETFEWSVAVGERIDRPYHYQVTFVDGDNQRIELEEATSRSPRLVVSQPQQESLEVAVVPAGTFGGDGLISQVVVALRYEDGDYTKDDIFTLTQGNETQIWEVPLLHGDQREYEYQATVFYSDGVTREDGWKRSDKSVLALGDPFGYRVQISPYLLADKGFSFGTLHLEFDDHEADIRAERTLEIMDFTKPLFWRFRLGAPDRHEYRYQLTLFTEQGDEVAVPEARAQKEVLVLRPPAA